MTEEQGNQIIEALREIQRLLQNVDDKLNHYGLPRLASSLLIC